MAQFNLQAPPDPFAGLLEGVRKNTEQSNALTQLAGTQLGAQTLQGQNNASAMERLIKQLAQSEAESRRTAASARTATGFKAVDTGALSAPPSGFDPNADVAPTFGPSAPGEVPAATQRAAVGPALAAMVSAAPVGVRYPTKPGEEHKVTSKGFDLKPAVKSLQDIGLYPKGAGAPSQQQTGQTSSALDVATAAIQNFQVGGRALTGGRVIAIDGEDVIVRMPDNSTVTIQNGRSALTQ